MIGKLVCSWGFVLLLAQCIIPFHSALVIPIAAANPKVSLAGISLSRVVLDKNNSNRNDDGENSNRNENDDNELSMVDLGAELGNGNGSRTMLVFGTHAGDFNTIEYLQKIMFIRDKLRTHGKIERIVVVINGELRQIKLLADLLDLSPEIELLSDPTGEAGRRFGVDRGFRPDDKSLSPFAKQFATGIGVGPPWMTLPAVLPGYTGNPSGKRDWIEASLLQGQLAGRWPSVLELEEEPPTGDKKPIILSNKFNDAPLGLGDWGRRPFELATLRLQSLIGIQIKHWSDLKPVDDRCLTQLGGCTVVESDGTAVYSWVDRGLCDVPDMDELLEAIA